MTNASYPTTPPPKSEFNVTCLVPHAVTGLQLSRNNVTGELDDALIAAAFRPLAPTLLALYARVNHLRGPITALLRHGVPNARRLAFTK